MEKDKKKAGKLATYATILLLMVIIVIIIAAMADNREERFITKIEETTQTNLTIQDEIVSVKDENYQLKKKIEELETTVSDNSAIINTNNSITEVWTLYKNKDLDGAKAKLSEINPDEIPEASKSYYEAVSRIINE